MNTAYRFLGAVLLLLGAINRDVPLEILGVCIIGVGLLYDIKEGKR